MTDAIPRSSQDLTDVESLGREAMRRRINGRLFGESVEPIQLGHFVVVGTLGRGGMGVVYEARDDRLGRAVAIKVIRGGNRRHSEQLRLLSEARAQARLSHPNVVQIHEVRETGDDVFIVMELVRGVTLDHWLKETPRPLPAVLAAFAAAGHGLAAAHAAGVVHRDVKPSNILVGDDGRVRIADFGLARGVHPEDSAAITRPSALDPASPTTAPSSDAMAGTPAYMSPEHALGQPDARSDQFSFCVALYEAVQGRNPFAPDGLAALLGADALPLHFDPGRGKLPRWLRRLLTRGLALAPGDRFPSMSALIAELERAPGRRRRRWLAAAGGALFGAGALLFASLPSRGSDPEIGPVCHDDSQAFAGVWDRERRGALARAFHATRTPGVDAAWTELERALDDYVVRWQTARRAICEAQGQQPTQLAQPDPGAACLERQREVLGALIDLYSHPDPQRIAGVGEAIDTLPAPAACLDPDRLALEVALGPDLRAGLERAELQQRSGQGRAALPELATLVGAAQATGNAAGEAEALLLRARIEAHDLAEFDRADATLRRAAELASTSGHDAIAWQIWNERARLAAHERGDLEHAREWVGLARSALERLPGRPRLHAASLLETESYVELLADRPDVALDLRRQALQIRELLLPAGHPTLVRTRMLVANAIADAGDLPGSLTLLQALLAEQTTRLGAGHPLTATIEYSAALVHFQLEHHAEARRMLLHHREVFSALAGPHDPKVAESDLYLGFIAHAEENYREAEARARAALAVFTARFPPTFPERVMALQLLLDINFVEDRYAELEARARELLVLHNAGARDLDEAGLLTNIGDSLCLQGRCSDALNIYGALALLVERDASLDPGKRAYPLQGLGRAHLARGDLVSAALYLERALEILQAHPDASPELQSQTARLLAETLQAQHRDQAKVRRLLALVTALEPRLREADPVE